MKIRVASKAFAAVLTSALLLTACGGSSDNEANDAGPESPAASSAESADPSQVDPADQATADAAVLTLQDLPVGWEATSSSEEDEDDVANQRAVAECVGVEWSDLYGQDGAKASSPDFSSQYDEQLSMGVSVAQDEARMINTFEIATRPAFRECMAESMEKLLAETDSDGVEVGDFSLNDVNIGQFGDETTAFRATIPVTEGAMSIDIVLEMALVRVDRGRIMFTSMGFGSGITTSELAEYVEISVDRLEEAFAESA